MTDQRDFDDVRKGDKVRIRKTPLAGKRGVIEGLENGLLRVVTDTGESVVVDLGDVTNYSLAARRAWKAMPKRAGRPSLDPKHRKKMVSLRLDPDVWERLGQAVKLGFVASKEEAVNSCVRDYLDKLFETSGDETQSQRH